jgi:hypothetical protein
VALSLDKLEERNKDKEAERKDAEVALVFARRSFARLILVLHS